MKTFIGALITLFLLAVIVTVNGIYIGHQTDNLLDACGRIPRTLDGSGELPPELEPTELPFEDAYLAVSLLWNDCRFIVCLSVSHAEAELIDEALTELGHRYLAGDNAGYMVARAALIDEISELQKSESFSAEGIL